MAFLSLSDLVQRTIVRLRQVPGLSTQAYAEQPIAHMIEEVYEQCRALRWWDHLTTWQQRTLDGVTGKVTVPFVGARERMRDVQSVIAGQGYAALTHVSQHHTPARYSGAVPRAVEALSIGDDPTGAYLFRVWPFASVGDVYVRLRADPAGLFTDNTVVVPFDATVLVNGAAMKYAIGDGTNPGQVQEFDRAHTERMKALMQQHDSTPLQLDSRTRWPDQWYEEVR